MASPSRTIRRRPRLIADFAWASDEEIQVYLAHEAASELVRLALNQAGWETRRMRATK